MRPVTRRALWKVVRRVRSEAKAPTADPSAFLNDVAAQLGRILHASWDADRKALRELARPVEPFVDGED